jgi:hypothetical protein
VKSIPLLRRVSDVFKNSIGLNSPLTSHITFKIANNLRINGEYDKAIKETNYLLTTNNNEDFIRAKLFISLCELMSGNNEIALNVALEACKKWEKNGSGETGIDETLISKNYAMIGK